MVFSLDNIRPPRLRDPQVVHVELEVTTDDILVTTCRLETRGAGEAKSVILNGYYGTLKEIIG